MRDLFYTILVAWIVWKIYESFTMGKNSGRPKGPFFNTNSGKPQGTSSSKASDDEYVDYEEIK
ncbi:MAG: hypothetical protein J0M08_08580 [Bacteroidetes bacterium]|nr:hypothetical protein [Bacteroidota bacterium]